MLLVRVIYNEGVGYRFSAPVQGHFDSTRGCWWTCWLFVQMKPVISRSLFPIQQITEGWCMNVNLDFLIMPQKFYFNPNVSCFFVSVWQVVELISSAIGDVVQGLYYENHNNNEVKHLFSFYCLTLMWGSRAKQPVRSVEKVHHTQRNQIFCS